MPRKKNSPGLFKEFNVIPDRALIPSPLWGRKLFKINLLYDKTGCF